MFGTNDNRITPMALNCRICNQFRDFASDVIYVYAKKAKRVAPFFTPSDEGFVHLLIITLQLQLLVCSANCRPWIENVKVLKDARLKPKSVN